MLNRILTLVYIVICSNIFGQFVGNEQQVNNNNTSNKKNDDDGIWKSRGYFAINRVRPTGIFSSYVEPSTTDFSDIYSQKTGFGAENGYGIEFGKLYFLNNLVFPNNTTLPENMRIGINANFINISILKYNWNRVNNLDFNEGVISSTSFKVGGFYSYNIIKNLFADAYFNLSPTIMMIGQTQGLNSGSIDFTSISNVGKGIKYDFGINLRYSRLLLGIFWNMGKTKHTFNYSNGNELITPVFKSSSFNIKLGVLFK